MKRPNFILVLLMLTIAAPTALPQTRVRRISETTSSPSPSTQEPATNIEGHQEIDVVRIETNLVTIPVSVVDRNGRSISDLQRADFNLFEDGIEQQIAYFETIEKPLTVVLMLDTSASTWSKLGQIKDAAKAFVEQLRPDDQVMVISFGMGVKVQCQPTIDRRKIGKAIEGTGKGLSTHLYDAMDIIMKKHLSRIQGRKALVLFTDGVDASSNHSTYKGSLHTAAELDALIYPILYDTYDPSIDTGGSTPQSNSRVLSILRKLPLPLPIPSIGGGSNGGGAGSTRGEYDRGERYLHELAELTGGRVYEASRDLSYLRDAFSHIADELGRQYSVGYYPKRSGQTGEQRQIKVRVNRNNVAVRARDKYVYKNQVDNVGKAASASKDKK